MKHVKTFTKLATEVEELLGELNEEHSPEVQELRRRVEGTLEAVKRGTVRQSNKASARIGRYASSIDGYIHDYPRLAFITAAIVFGTIGYVKGATLRGRHE